ncbi:MAG: ABC transporter ATP-binding protein [Actinobacteria bacterium]|nr:MAG: ABC transporter ATP-binding protein [Actinomycetota bacterium]
MRPLLRLRNVESRYGAFVALQHVSLIVPEGSVVALLGPNGVGKTTLLRTVSGMMSPTDGEITFDGVRIDDMRDHEIARLGLEHIPEGRGIFPSLTVRENLQMAAYTTESMNGALARVHGLFPVLKQRRDQIAGTLSGGEQQMLSLARSIITQPKLLMVDELSLGLAPRLVAQLFDTLEKIKRDGTTILLVEQYVRYALRLADIVVILHKGRVAFIGEPGELAHEGKLVDAYLGGSQAESATAEAEEQGGPRPQRRASGGATSGARPKRKPSAPRGSTRRSSPS